MLSVTVPAEALYADPVDGRGRENSKKHGGPCNATKDLGDPISDGFNRVIFRAAKKPIVIAGLIWQPEMEPSA